MSRKYFGTDGVRGVANGKLTPELAFQLGWAAGRWLKSSDQPHRAVIGRDTRRSGPMLGAALAAGLCSAGIDVVAIGHAPTPTISFLARTGDYGLGGIISASHNPAPDNGVKFVGHDGRKLPDEVEALIESLMDPVVDRPEGREVGYLNASTDVEAYLQFLEAIVPERLDGVRVAVDAAHGAAYHLGPEILRRLGAIVFSTGVTPDGMNINAEGGATKPETIQEFTVRGQAEIGVAFDGDADRAVFSDDKGRLINGDRTLGIWASDAQERGELVPPIVVGTVMSNGGFEAFLKSKEIQLERTPVGDKYVAQKLAQTGALIGGEQSGHVIFPHHGPTGDGLVTMLELLRVLRRTGKSASELYDIYAPWPQILVNMTVRSTVGWEQVPEVASALDAGLVRLGGEGRLVVRASGTQPMVRVMVEASSYELRDEISAIVVQAMVASLEGRIYSQVDLTHALGD
ncbi:MAG: phosphoglucosamine mutase [Fimbriimonas sp.]